MASKFNILRQEKFDLKAEALAILEIAAQHRTAAQVKQLDAIEARMPTLDKEIDRMAAALEAERIAPVDGPAASIVRPSGGKRFAELFGASSIDNGGWDSPDQFLAALHQGLNDPRLAFSPALGLRATGTVGVPSDGGFSVPTQIVSVWMDASLEDEVVRPRATVYAMTGHDLHVPGFDASDHTSLLYGGFAGGWVAEASEITPEQPKLRLIALAARKLGVLAEISNELLSDGVGYASQLSTAIIKAIGFYLDYGFLNGTGASQPLGVLNSPAVIAVTKEIQQTAATVNYHNLSKMFARMAPASVKNAVWVAHPSCIPSLTVLSIPMGTSAAHIPVMSDSDGSFKILTRPVVFTEKVPTIGNQGDIGLYDFSQYAIALRADVTLDKSMHPGFTRDTSHFRGILRGDGMPMWNKPLTLKGGTTVSPFVVLEPRT
jgi:HK97 family phage major capsid protein